MGQVPVRELNQHTAEVLARVEAGEQVRVTRNGVPIAVIHPIQPDPLAALVASGEVRPATRGWRDLPVEEEPVNGSPGVAAVEQDRHCGERW